MIVQPNPRNVPAPLILIRFKLATASFPIRKEDSDRFWGCTQFPIHSPRTIHVRTPAQDVINPFISGIIPNDI